MSKNDVRQRPLNAREAALKVLLDVECNGAYSNLALNRILKSNRISAQDAALATELVYGTIQRQNTIDYFLDRFVSSGLHKLETWVLCLLRMSFYQIYYLDNIPDYAVVHEAVTIARKKGHRGIAGMVNGVLRSILRERDDLTIPETLPTAERLSLIHSHPKWMVYRWANQYGWELTGRICEANNRIPLPTLRVNTLKVERDAYMEQLRARQIEVAPSRVSPAGIVWTSGGNPAHDDGFKRGEFTIQGESSMLVGEIVDPKPGMKVLDACAAPGGKTTHLAEKMKNEGYLYANDIHPHKEKLIRDQAERLGLTCIRTGVGNALYLGDKFPNHSFDRILIDAPCSGLGVIRHRPDLKWRKQETQLPDIVQLQMRLLHSLADLLKPGGVLVYSTCTIEQKENEYVVQHFLNERPEFTLDREAERFWPKHLPDHCRVGDGMLRLFPHDLDSDGFFIARLRKKSDV